MQQLSDRWVSLTGMSGIDCWPLGIKSENRDAEHARQALAVAHNCKMEYRGTFPSHNHMSIHSEKLATVRPARHESAYCSVRRHYLKVHFDLTE